MRIRHSDGRIEVKQHDFQILTYLHKLENVSNHRSWISADCPICGEHKLKIVAEGTKKGAYSCYSSSQCHLLRKEGTGYQPSLIAAKLQEGEFRPRRSSSPRQIRIPKLRDIIKPLPLNLSEIDVTQFFSSISYKKPWSTYFENETKFTIYPYDDFQLIRCDPRHEKKFFYFRIKKDNGEWSNEVPTKFNHVPVYRSCYLAAFVVFVEGEKVASYLQELGINAVSFPSFVYQQSHLAKFLRCLSYKVKNIIYLEDNDETGKQKAQKFLQEAWKSGISASSYNIAQLLGRGAEKNYDAADAIENWEICTREELLGLLKGCNTQKALG
jgi:hypothetical protein